MYFKQSRDIVYVRSIRHKERVYNKFRWVLKIDIEKSWDFLFFAKNHWFFIIFPGKAYLGGGVRGPPRDSTASRMSIFRTHPDVLQTRSLCWILRRYTISRDCKKSKILFSLRKIFFEGEPDRGAGGGARGDNGLRCSQRLPFSTVLGVLVIFRRRSPPSSGFQD